MISNCAKKENFSPFLHDSCNGRDMSLDVIIALLPLLVWACYVFGMRALTVTLLSVALCTLFEFLYTLIMRKKASVLDLSSVVTGMLLAYGLPHTVPFWILPIGAFIAIILVKMLFGGLGKNIFNPALSGKLGLLLIFSSATAIPHTIIKLGFIESGPLSVSHAGTDNLTALLTPPEDGISNLTHDLLFDMFIGNESGTIGEVSALLLLAGLVYLLVRKTISIHIPLSYIATVALITFVLPGSGFERFDYLYTLSHLCSGGILFSAIFMACDPVTSPLTPKGCIIFGICCGILTVLMRYLFAVDGCTIAILLSNLLVFPIDKFTAPRPLGKIPRLKKQEM